MRGACGAKAVIFLSEWALAAPARALTRSDSVHWRVYGISHSNLGVLRAG